jgi:formylglycine-generating enzyme required for sulfatase activity
MGGACTWLSVIAALAAATIAPCQGAEADRAGMVLLPASLYTPFQRLKAASAAESSAAVNVRIARFWLDAELVTNAQFLDFATIHPQWRKSQIKSVFADDRYLRRWSADLELPDAESTSEPVTNVSWFAAQAYCRARGLRLPTTDQWEYALADDGRDQADVKARSLEWFAKPNPTRPGIVGRGRGNGFGVGDLVGLVWEWTLDFDAFSVITELRDPNGKNSGEFCGGAAAGVADASDYPAFMRFALRASLKAGYTADNVGFRCAGEF